MLDLNVVSVMDNYYRFATDGFRKFLGSQDKVEKSMADYPINRGIGKPVEFKGAPVEVLWQIRQ